MSDALRKNYFQNKWPFNGFSYKEYEKWDDSRQWEMIDGVPYMMAPPVVNHQRMVMHLYDQIKAYLKEKTCEVFISPIGVRLFPAEDKSDKEVVQPDLFVVCNPDIIGENSINGVPDLIIEIISQSTKKYDKFIKFAKYRQVGVKEYWIVDYEGEEVHVYKWKNGDYIADIYSPFDTIDVGVLPGLAIDMKAIFKIQDEAAESE